MSKEGMRMHLLTFHAYVGNERFVSPINEHQRFHELIPLKEARRAQARMRRKGISSPGRNYIEHEHPGLIQL